MIFLQIILLINTFVANISCTSFERIQQINGELLNLQQKDSQSENTDNLLKNTVDENQAKIQVLNLQIEKLEEKLNETIENTGIP